MAVAPFRVGQKELYLPRFALTFLRSPSLPPTQARFLVPLWFSKLDLRDYLYHVYSVRTHSITSYVKQQRARYGTSTPVPLDRRWHRPRARKYMTVQLERPFVWPAEPEDLSAWNKGEVEGQESERKVAQERMAPFADTLVQKDRREGMREQAKKLLEGKGKWKGSVGSRNNMGRMLTR